MLEPFETLATQRLVGGSCLEQGVGGMEAANRCGGFHSHGDAPKWMVYEGKSYLGMDDLGVPLF